MIAGFPVQKCAVLADPRPKNKTKTIMKAMSLFERQCAELGLSYESFIGVPLSEISPSDDVDVFVVLGGDGTMIHYAGPLSHFGIPFYGLNYGHVGFMMNTVEPQMERNLARLANGAFGMWQFPLLEVDATDLKGNPHHGYGLNDIYLQRMTSQTCKLRLSINKVPLAFNPVLCDGVIVSNPLGSTAYSFNVTGSVVSIDCKALTLTPIAANRTCPIKSLILPMDATIEIEVLEPTKRKVLIVSDATNHGNIARAEIKASPKTVRLCFSTDTSNLPLALVNKCKI
ncbi:MAG: NAD(+)/NADH kinase [Acidobacteria bacterium]|nr:NAD(+)/NADH kinase [Acidobacteriota bacterium]